MPVPATTGQLRTRIQDMQMGDYIACKASTGAILNNNAKQVAYSIGTSVTSEIPLTGMDSTVGANGYYYFIKVDKGLLIADRVIFQNVSWDKLNSLQLIEGYTTAIDGSSYDLGVPGVIRSLGGGNSYASATGTSQTTNADLGAWPVDNEWDKYIINFSTKLIQSGKTLNDVFHIASDVNTWCQDTTLNGVMNVTHTGNRRMTRSNPSNNNGGIGNIETTRTATWLGFRPVFEFQEVIP
ncbi:hypothetical protein K7T73_15355 [Bacillus badius]|uniref:hypothetical protein n=1 Tax=Bacillus badius TaxID=1455 RepID=UPI001CBD8229|nr:hypothetical protein [Bacillus badius]UAT29924.1 hypothetical protein K7T73_15355 [Bacillus badius]